MLRDTRPIVASAVTCKKRHLEDIAKHMLTKFDEEVAMIGRDETNGEDVGQAQRLDRIAQQYLDCPAVVGSPSTCCSLPGIAHLLCQVFVLIMLVVVANIGSSPPPTCACIWTCLRGTGARLASERAVQALWPNCAWNRGRMTHSRSGNAMV